MMCVTVLGEMLRRRHLPAVRRILLPVVSLLQGALLSQLVFAAREAPVDFAVGLPAVLVVLVVMVETTLASLHDMAIGER